MLEHLVKVHPLVGVDNEALFDKVLGSLAHIDVFGEAKGTCLDLLVGLLDLNGLEGRPSTEHRIQDDSDRPVINFIGVSTVLVKNLWGEIVRCSADGPLTFILVEHLCCQTEVSNLEHHPVGQEEISQLQVSVDHFLRVSILNCFDKLVDVITSLDFMETFSSANQV